MTATPMTFAQGVTWTGSVLSMNLGVVDGFTITLGAILGFTLIVGVGLFVYKAIKGRR